MADNPEPDGERLAYQSAYPGLHRNYGCKKFSFGTYVWRIQPDEAVDQVENQSYRLYWYDTNQSVVS